MIRGKCDALFSVYRYNFVICSSLFYLQQNRLSKAEMAHLRLAAGAAMLKICEQKGVGDQFTAEQFYNLSHLMIVSLLDNSVCNSFMLVSLLFWQA